MTITVDIRPEARAELARQAAARGRAIEAHAASLLEDALHLPTAQPALPAQDMVELFAPLRGLDLNFEHERDPGRDMEL